MGVYRRILMPIDAGHCAPAAIGHLARFAADQRAEVKVITVIDEDAADYLGSEMAWSAPELLAQTLQDSADQTLARARALLLAQGLAPETERVDCADGRIENAIVRAAASWRADLIALPSHHRRGLSRLLLGSMSERLLGLVRIPLLILPCA